MVDKENMIDAFWEAIKGTRLTGMLHEQHIQIFELGAKWMQEQQIKRDAEICNGMYKAQEEMMKAGCQPGDYKSGYADGSGDCAHVIINQENEK